MQEDMKNKYYADAYRPDLNSKNCEVDKEWFLTEDELF